MPAHLILARNFALCAVAILMMVRGYDFKFARRACEQCGERGEHLVGCPGRRGY